MGRWSRRLGICWGESSLRRGRRPNPTEVVAGLAVSGPLSPLVPRYMTAGSAASSELIWACNADVAATRK